MKVFPVNIIIDGKDVSYEMLEDIPVNGFVIPVGFVSDGCSSPRKMWSVFPPVQDYFISCVLHDYLLSIGHSWKYAEKQFKESLKMDNVGTLRRTLMVNAVRVWGIFSGKRKIFEKDVS